MEPGSVDLEYHITMDFVVSQKCLSGLFGAVFYSNAF